MHGTWLATLRFTASSALTSPYSYIGAMCMRSASYSMPQSSPINSRCLEHYRYKTELEAQTSLSKWALICLTKPKDNSDWQRLSVFQCGDHWHIGRQRSGG